LSGWASVSDSAPRPAAHRAQRGHRHRVEVDDPRLARLGAALDQLLAGALAPESVRKQGEHTLPDRLAITRLNGGDVTPLPVEAEGLQP